MVVHVLRWQRNDSTFIGVEEGEGGGGVDAVTIHVWELTFCRAISEHVPAVVNH